MTFSSLVGKTLKSITGAEVGSDRIIFETNDNMKFKMFHDQDCCESVLVEDICGDIQDLIDSPILIASEDTSTINPVGVDIKHQESFTWTFYNIATKNGHVTIRWYGESNGYYSESVDFEEMKCRSLR